MATVKKIKDLEYKRVDVAAECAYTDDAIARAKAASSAEELAAIRAEVNKHSEECSTSYALAYIRHSLDVNDKFYSAEIDYYDENLPQLSAKSTALMKALIESPYIDGLGKIINPIIIENMRAQVRVMDDRIIKDCVEENKLVTEYDKLMAELKFPWEGKDLTLEEMRGLAKAADRATRKNALSVIGTTLESVSDKLDELYDKLVKVRTRKAKKMGFTNFVEMGDIAIQHIGYGRKEIAVFRESVLRDVVPTLTRLKAELAKKLGIDSIHLYDNDNYIAGGNIDPVGSAEDLFKAAQSMYDDMHPALGSFFESMCDAEAIDYKARNGKMGGGYAEMLFGFGQPFIFANFNGTMDDVGVLTHELGHAFAFKRAVDNDIDVDLFVGGMETAETHSMGMEAMCNKFNDRFYGERAREATYQQIFDAFNFLPYGVIVDYFQELVYTKPDMTPKERKALWLELESEFRPYIDMTDVPYMNIGGRWQYQHHIYDNPFYYIDYCLSNCLALQFGELAAVDYNDALERYLGFVDKGGTKRIDDLAHEAGLVSPFDKGALKSLCEAVEKHIQNLE